MSEKKIGGRGKQSRMKAGKAPRGRSSAGWEEHSERVMAAIRCSTDFFMRSNEERIAGSSSAVTAKNSYITGMIDMLTTARNTFGFWGAEQILQELERQVAKHSQEQEARVGPGVDSGGNHSRCSAGPVGMAGSPEAEQKVARGIRADPMFA